VENDQTWETKNKKKENLQKAETNSKGERANLKSLKIFP